MLNQSPKIRKLTNIAIRFAVVGIAYVALYIQLRKHEDLLAQWDRLLDNIYTEKNLLPLFLVVLLMGVNWSLEALKWRLLIIKSERISFFRSLKGIFTGISVGTFTPNRLGEFLGRSFVLDRSHPWKVFFMTIIGSYSQLLSTILFGSVGMLFFITRYAGISTGINYLDVLIGFFGFATAILVMLLYFNIDLFDKYLGPYVRKRKPAFAAKLAVISSYSFSELLWVLLFSIGRYMVFSIQFYLLFRFFDFAIPFRESVMFTSVIYLVMTIIPSMALSEIGVRGSVALFFFAFYTQEHSPDINSTLSILSASTLLWVINLVIPAILGTFFIYHFKVFRNSNQARK